MNGQEVAITLYDTPAANALYDMLPLDLNFEDFNGIEKISYLSQISVSVTLVILRLLIRQLIHDFRISFAGCLFHNDGEKDNCG